MQLPFSRLFIAMVTLTLVLTACGPSGAVTSPTAAAGSPTPTVVAGQPTRTPLPPTAVNTPLPVAKGYSPLGAQYEYGKHPLPGAKYGGTFTTFIERGPGSCTKNWRPDNGRVASNTCNGFFNALLRTGAGDQLLPDLAETWESTKDGKTWTFTLRQGVKFHDGTEFTADAVVYNLMRQLNPPKGTVPPVSLRDAGMTQVQALDKHHVRIELSSPYAEFLDDMASSVTNIACPAAYEKLIAAGKPPLFIDFSTTCGTGAFKPLRHVEEGSYESQRNTEYWLKGLPYIDGMKVLVVPDQSTRIALMLTGRADMYQATELPYPDRLAIEANARFKDGRIVTYEYANGLKQNVHINLQSPQMQDKRVREAILRVTNVTEAHRVIGYGRGAWEGLPMPKSSGWALPDAEMRAYPGQGPDPDADLARAKQLMIEAGFPQGFALRPIQQRVTDKAVANMNFVVSRLNLIGIKMEGRPVDAAAHSLYNDNHNYDVDAGYDGGSFRVGGTSMMNKWLCTGRPTCNPNMYNNPEYERLYSLQRATLDAAARKLIVDEMQRMVLKEYMYGVTQWSVRNAAWQSYVKNYDPTSQEQSFIHNTRYEMIWLDK